MSGKGYVFAIPFIEVKTLHGNSNRTQRRALVIRLLPANCAVQAKAQISHSAMLYARIIG
jgi:hypothetical protein